MKHLKRLLFFLLPMVIVLSLIPALTANAVSVGYYDGGVQISGGTAKLKIDMDRTGIIKYVEQ